MTVGVVRRLLRGRGETLVLFDVGASAGLFAPFDPLLPISVYVGFDADFVGTHTARRAKRSLLLQTLIREPGNGATVPLFITRNPTSSSTLEPNGDRVRLYAFSHRFDVIRTETMAAKTLDAVLDENRLDRIDWLKLDTQGTDLRIALSLSAARFDQLLCIDVEPGFDDYYRGEDTFAPTHRELTARGFFLAHAAVQGAPRIDRAVAEARLGLNSRLGRHLAEMTLPTSPTAIEARYLRTIESMDAASVSMWLRLYACASASGLHGYALEVADALCQAHPAEPSGPTLLRAARRRARWHVLLNAWRLWRRVSPAKLRRLLAGG